MKFRYDKTKGEVVEKPEPEPPKPFDLLPVPPEVREQMESFQAMQQALRKVFG